MRAAHLYNAHIRLLSGLVYGNFGDTLDPVLYSIRNMGDDLSRPIDRTKVPA